MWSWKPFTKVTNDCGQTEPQSGGPWSENIGAQMMKWGQEYWGLAFRQSLLSEFVLQLGWEASYLPDHHAYKIQIQ